MATMTEFVKVIYGNKEFQLPLIVGSEGEKAIDISKLRQNTGLITLDTGYANTGSCIGHGKGGHERSPVQRWARRTLPPRPTGC